MKACDLPIGDSLKERVCYDASEQARRLQPQLDQAADGIATLWLILEAVIRYFMFSRALLVAGLCATLSGVALAETASVKYRGPVPLDTFQCATVDRSSLVKRVCYDAVEQYMVILLKGTYYHYCEIDKGTVDSLLAAESMGRYFQANIKGSGSDGPFDCRTHRAPQY